MENVILGVITPDAFKCKEKIFDILKKHHFQIKDEEAVFLKDKDIEKLYSNPERLILRDWKKGEVSIFLASRKKSILEQICSVLFFSKKDPEKELIKLVGNIDQPSTIRGKFALSQSKCAIFVPQQENILDYFFAS